MTTDAIALGSQIRDSLYDVIDAERPSRDALVSALALAVGHCLVCNIAAYDQPEAKQALISEIERAVSVFQSVSVARLAPAAGCK